MLQSTYDVGQQHTKVLNEALPIEEVVGSHKEVPAERTEPRQLMGLVHYIANGDDLMETLDLDE